MHFSDGSIPEEYRRYIGWKSALLFVVTGALLISLLVAVSLGAAHIPLADVARSLTGAAVSKRFEMIL